MKPQWQQTSFWLTGGVLLFALVAVIVVQFMDWNATIQRTEAAAIADARLADPDTAWAFDEWQRCNSGYGDYAKFVYIEIEQCNMALTALGQQRGRLQDVERALAVLKQTAKSTDASLAPWPLSFLLSD